MHNSACGEVGTAYMLHQVGYCSLWVVHKVAEASRYLAQVMRGYLARHADGDAYGAIA